jgi:hypothetical protein
MKNRVYIIFCLVILFSFYLSTSTAQEQKGAEIKFDKLVHDYGNIYQNDNGTTVFEFTNTGNEPLIIDNVKYNCGCTVPEWTKEPVLPGQRGAIKVVYDTRRIGTINKQISVYSNAQNGIVNLAIKGNVLKKPSEIMPIKAINNSATPVAR